MRWTGSFFPSLNAFQRLAFALLLAGTLPAQAFDDDREISDVKLKSETFLDLNANSFRRTLDLAWLDVKNGWRMVGGSTSTDRLFLRTDLRMQSELSRHLQVGLSLEQDDFYAKKPLSLPQVSIDVYPLEEHDIGFSILGTAAHDKRQADLGYALTLGRRYEDYVRVSWLKVDTFYNEKNEFDDSRYDNFGETLTLEGQQTLNEHWRLVFDLKKDRPLRWLAEADSREFKHEAGDYSLTGYYARDEHVFGLRGRLFDIDKSLRETASDVAQTLDYQHLDLFAVTQHDSALESTFGLRYDRFDEILLDDTSPGNSFDFTLHTWQTYTSVYFETTAHQAWDLGLFAGWSDFEKRYTARTTDSPADEFTEQLEAKFRASWQYRSADGRSTLALNLSLNLDDLFNDPGDGGGLYFQTYF